MARPSGLDPERLSIANQFRDRRDTIYDLTCGPLWLSLRIGPTADTEPSGYRASASDGHRGRLEPAPITAVGSTRLAVLEAVGAEWEGSHEARGLPRVDWADVRRALEDVRAFR